MAVVKQTLYLLLACEIITIAYSATPIQLLEREFYFYLLNLITISNMFTRYYFYVSSQGLLIDEGNG